MSSPKKIFVAQGPIERIFTSGTERAIVLTSTSLLSIDSDQRINFSEGTIFPDEMLTDAHSTPLIFADRWNSDQYVLSEWKGHCSINDTNALVFGDSVTCISQNVRMNMVIVGLRTGIKIFRLARRNFYLVLQMSCMTSSPVTRIVLEDGNRDKGMLTFSAHLGDKHQLTVREVGDGDWNLSQITNQRTLLHAEGPRGTLHITEASLEDPILSWIPKGSCVGEMKTFSLGGEIHQAIVPQISRLKHVCVILLRCGEVVIANLLKPMSQWVRINEKRYSSLAVTTCMANDQARILLASGNEVFEDNRLNFRDGF